MSAKNKVRRTSDAVEILHRRYVRGNPKMQAMVEEERENAAIAREIHRLRIEAGLSQRKLAEKVGKTASVVCRLERADYQGHSLTMLRRIARVLNRRVEVRFVPAA